MSKIVEKLVVCPVLFIIWLIGCEYDETSPLVLLTIVLVSLRLIILYKNVQPVFIFYLFQLTYVLILIPYFIFGIPIVPYEEFQVPAYMIPTLLIHGSFIFALYLFSDLNIPGRKIVFSSGLPRRDNLLVRWLLIGLMGAVLVYMTVNKQNIYAFEPGKNFETYCSNNVNASGVPEYFLVLFLLAFIFSKKRSSQLVLIGIFSVYFYLAFTRGIRVSLLMLILMFFSLFFDGKIKTRNILLFALGGVALFQAWGFLRDGKRDFFQLFTIFSGGQILTNQSEVFYTSNVIVSSIIDNVISLEERIFSLLSASLQVILPPRLVYAIESKPALYVWNVTERAAGGGGLISAFFYFWGSYLGVIVIAGFLAWINNRAIKNLTPLLSIYIICVYSCYPRWLVYDPINFLFRLPLYAIFLYCFIHLLNLCISKSGFADYLSRHTKLP